MVRVSLRVYIAVVASGLLGCGAAKVQPALDLSVRPRSIDNKTGKAVVTVNATDAMGKIGTGQVTVTSTAGSLAGGETLTLANGAATVDFTCPGAANPACLGSVTIDASWTSDGVKTTATSSVLVTGPAAPDAGPIIIGNLDGGTFGEYSIILTLEKALLLKGTGDSMAVTAKVVKTNAPSGGLPGAMVVFTAEGGASFAQATATPAVTVATDSSGVASTRLYVASAQVGVKVTAAAFDASAFQGLLIANVSKIQWASNDPRTKTTLTVRSTGIDSSTNVYFKVTDSSDMPVSGADVSFDIVPGSAAGATVSPTWRTGADGIAQTNLAAGEAAGQVGVRAVVTATKGSITNELLSNASLTIALGRASDGRFDVSCSRKTIGALQSVTPPRVDVTTPCVATYADRSGNKLPFSVPVSWLSEAGAFDPASASDPTHGSANITFAASPGLPKPATPLLGEPSLNGRNPRDGFVTIVAALKGEEEFWDGSGDGGVATRDGQWTPGEWFVDLPEPFVDQNDDGTYNDGEPYLDTERIDCTTGQKLALNGHWDGPNGCWDRDTTIWRSAHVVYTDAFSIIEWSPPADMDANTTANVPFSLYDFNYNRVSNDSVSVSARIVTGTPIVRGSIALTPPSLGESFGHDLEYFTGRGTESNGVITLRGTCNEGDRTAPRINNERCFRLYRFNSWKTSGTSGNLLLVAPPPQMPPGPTTTVFELAASNAYTSGFLRQFSVVFKQ